MNDRFTSMVDLTSAPNWGVESNAPAIPAETWSEIYNLYIENRDKRDLPEPFISPCEDGLVHITYRNEDRTALFRLEYADKQAYISYRNKNQTETTYVEGMIPIETAIQNLTKWNEENCR